MCERLQPRPRAWKGRSPRACAGDFGRGASASRWTLITQVMLFFPLSSCRCVEIIAKEGRSLKELYLVSCKITDHGRTLSSLSPPPQGCSKHFINVLLGITVCLALVKRLTAKHLSVLFWQVETTLLLMLMYVLLIAALFARVLSLWKEMFAFQCF